MSQLALKLGSYLRTTSLLAYKLGVWLKLDHTFIKFLLIGILNTFVGLGMMFLLIDAFGWPYWLATSIGNAVGAVVSFSMNRLFTFKSNVSVKHSAPRFAAVIISCYLFSYSLSRLLADSIVTLVPINKDSLAILFGTGIYTLTNYMGQKWFVFKRGTT